MHSGSYSQDGKRWTMDISRGTVFFFFLCYLCEQAHSYCNTLDAEWQFAICKSSPTVLRERLSAALSKSVTSSDQGTHWMNDFSMGQAYYSCSCHAPMTLDQIYFCCCRQSSGMSFRCRRCRCFPILYSNLGFICIFLNLQLFFFLFFSLACLSLQGLCWEPRWFAELFHSDDMHRAHSAVSVFRAFTLSRSWFPRVRLHWCQHLNL